ncbi:MAG TPA: FAD-binding oxidoreductase [Mycobacteriales bacterium]|nr:FAD-binding oxidoreductase [Mycobacteriales bacterium]
MSDQLLAALRDAVGERHVLDDRSVVASYESDWTGRFHGTARCVVRPGSSGEVAAVVRGCAEAGVAICVQGGNTGLVGGSVPVDGAVVLSLLRLDAIEPVDEVAAQVTVGAGCTLAALQRVVRAAGFDVGVDFAARDSCTIGGMVATNAGGERVLRYGTMRAQLVGVEAVLADGSVVSRLAGLPKDNTGYDVVSLLAGSEGTLGVITRLRLRLVPLLSARAIALVAVAGTAEAVELVRAIRVLPSLEAAELFYADGLALVREYTGVPAPFAKPHPAYLLVECAGRDDPADDLLAALEAAGDLVLDATVASDPRGRHALWAYRESHTEAINAAGVPVKLDVAVPLVRLADGVTALAGAIAAVAPDARAILFGHVNEGNLHVNVLGALDQDEAVSHAVLRLVASYGGSISAEHGVGRAKRSWLHLSRSTEEIAMMRAIKTALDPAGRLNPGVLLD